MMPKVTANGTFGILIEDIIEELNHYGYILSTNWFFISGGGL